ncbi:hypothetical protein A0H81_05474 [Grifola frondosa]|uniref:Secreted protein n=1 Tax=Grifola frondosa TaxID=5627 RepID=A0A1C7MDG9_GRIFR|nr:hypothetical protein A0H81_05474 [Grifola frondosa]
MSVLLSDWLSLSLSLVYGHLSWIASHTLSNVQTAEGDIHSRPRDSSPQSLYHCVPSQWNQHPLQSTNDDGRLDGQ